MQKIKTFLGLNNLKSRLWFVLTLNLFDLLATQLWISLFGTEVEGNPLARIMFENNTVYFYKIILIPAMLYLLYKILPNHKNYEWTTWVLFYVYAGIAVYHLFLGLKLMTIFFL